MSDPAIRHRGRWWSRIPLVVFGVWLLFRQALEPLLADDLWCRGIDGVSIASCFLFLLWTFRHLESDARRRIGFGVAILLAGMFVLLLAPHEAQPDTVLWVSTLKLFASRFLPFLGLLAVMLVWRGRRVGAAVLTPFKWWMKLSRLAYTAIGACVAFLSSWLMAEFAYGGLPVVDDGVAHLLQARIFASGHLTLPTPPHPDAFSFFGLIQDPAWVAMYPPGYPVLLAAALLCGCASLLNPLLTALTAPAIGLIAVRSVGKKAAALTMLLFAFSPFVPILGGSFRNHSLSLFLLAWSTGLLLDPRRRTWSILLAGVLGGLAFLARPYTAFLWYVGLALAMVIHDGKRFLRLALPFGAGALPGIALAFLYNLVQTGGTFIPAPVYLYGSEFALGFGPRMLGEHTILRAISYTMTRIQALGRMVMGWPFPLVLLPFAVLVLPGRPLRSRTARWILIVPPVAVVVGYGLYWCLEFTHGPRFVYCILATLLPLCAESLLVLPERIGGLLHGEAAEKVKKVLGVGLLLSIIYAGVVTWPQTVRAFGSYGSSRPDIAEHVKRLPPGRKLVFFSSPSKLDSGFGFGLLLNDLSLSGELVVVRDRDEATNRRILERFPGRTAHRYRYDLPTGRGSLEPVDFDTYEEGIQSKVRGNTKG